MTRKRFVKILMGKGLPRNYADDAAKTFQKYKLPYDCGFRFGNSGMYYENRRARYWVKFLWGGEIRVEKYTHIPHYLIPYADLKLETGFAVNEEMLAPPFVSENKKRIKAPEGIGGSGWFLRREPFTSGLDFVADLSGCKSPDVKPFLPSLWGVSNPFVKW